MEENKTAALLREIREKYTWSNDVDDALYICEKALRVYTNPDTVSRADAFEMFDKKETYTGDEVRAMLSNLPPVKEVLTEREDKQITKTYKDASIMGYPQKTGAYTSNVLEMKKCNNQCEKCGRYTAVHYNGTEYAMYKCYIANKYVKVIYDENDNEERRDVFLK